MLAARSDDESRAVSSITDTLSRTVNSFTTCSVWNVRRMPHRARLYGAIARMSVPSTVIEP